MKIILSFFLLLLSLEIYSQKEINLDNNLSGIFSESGLRRQYQLNFQGTNGLSWKKSSFDSQTNFAFGFNQSISQNELIQRSNLGTTWEKADVFCTHQFNYSLTREILSDNWIGVGSGFKKVIPKFKFSTSYAFIFQRTRFFDQRENFNLRHSIRLKFKYGGINLGLISEYYYQPEINNFSDYIIYGTTKLSFFPNKPLNFIIQDVVNFRSVSTVNMIHNLTLGISYKFSKKFQH